MSGDPAAPRVCLTFDFDAMASWLRMAHAAGTPVSFTDLSRGEFAARVGVPRVLETLDSHGVTSTWFVPGQTIDTYPELCRAIDRGGHELAHHGYLHETPLGLSRAEELDALERGLAAFDRHLGIRPSGYRSPTWALSAHSVELLVDCGFTYDSSMMADDFHMYRCRRGDIPHLDRAHGFGEDTDLVELPVSWAHTDFPRYELLYHAGLFALFQPVEQARDEWLADFHFMCDRFPTGVFVLTLHPETIGRGARIQLLEGLITTMRAAGATFHRADALAREWLATNAKTSG